MKAFLFLVLILAFLTSIFDCAMNTKLDVVWVPSNNYGPRIDRKTNVTVEKPIILVLHYTVSNLSDTIRIFQTNGTVSSHYTVAKNGTIYQHVKEQDRAWHAGAGSWKNISDVNTYSIGMEIENGGFRESPDQPEGQKVNGSALEWYPFQSQSQIDSVVRLAKDIVQRYKIKPTNVIAHADLAPGRKQDPGPLFFWNILAKNEVGAWINKNEFHNASDISILSVQKKLRDYGYTTVPLSGELDGDTKNGLFSFQMHYRQSNIDSLIDDQTVKILDALLKKYHV